MTKTLSRPEVDSAIGRMAADLRELLSAAGRDAPLLIGIHTGGVWVADALRQSLSIEAPVGALNINFYRDDFSRIDFNPQVLPSDLPFALDDRHLVLVDDVLHTGRTIRAALNELFDYGRPASVLLAVLAERNGRELPIQADVRGFSFDLNPGQHVHLDGPEAMTLTIQESHG